MAVAASCSPNVSSIMAAAQMAARGLITPLPVYLGAEHFVWGYGYDIIPRQSLTKLITGQDNNRQKINVINQIPADYWWTTQAVSELPKVYQDERGILYQIKN